MKNFLIFLFLAFVTTLRTNAQNYTVGVPVDDTITSLQLVGGTNNCFPDYDFNLSFPFSTVTGINHILIFKTVTPINSVFTVPGDTVNSGDTLIFTQSQHSYEFYFPTMGLIDFVCKSVGVPQIADETFECGTQWSWVGDATTCKYDVLFFWVPPTQCTVSGTTFIKMINGGSNEILLLNNPVTNFLELKTSNDSKLSEVKILNLLGKVLYSTSTDEIQTNINLQKFNPGLYILETVAGNQILWKKFIKQ